jgi:hypothetical protein
MANLSEEVQHRLEPHWQSPDPASRPPNPATKPPDRAILEQQMPDQPTSEQS